MAGAGYKLFNTGDVLTAAQVNTYLQEQAVMRFANATARTTALSGVLAEGMMSYLDDTNTVEVYNGSAWVSVGSTGDITGVTAGTGISGGGTSGDVTITNSMATAIDAKGDLIVGTGSDAFSRLAVGANNTVLTADSSTATGLKWAAASGGGKVLQVVQGTTSTATTIATTTYTDTSLSLAITPTASTSKILVLINQIYTQDRLTDSTPGMGIRILRDSTTIFTPAPTKYEIAFNIATGTTRNKMATTTALTYLDSPNTTSSVTYKTQAALNTTGNTPTSTFQESSSISVITLMEIGA